MRYANDKNSEDVPRQSFPSPRLTSRYTKISNQNGHGGSVTVAGSTGRGSVPLWSVPGLVGLGGNPPGGCRATKNARLVLISLCNCSTLALLLFSSS